MAQSIKIDTSNYLGVSYSTYKNKLLEIALTQPSEYFKIRANVLKNVKENAISKMYETFFEVMSSGRLTAGGVNAATVTGNEPAATLGDINVLFRPNYPNQKITEFALGAAKTLDAICDECIEIIMPLNYRDLAESRLARKGESDRML